MLSRINRLSKQKDFEIIFRRGKECRNDWLVIKSLINRQPFFRFGLVISAKVSKKAVRRNRLRRQIRAILHRHWAEIKPGLDVIIIARPKLLELDYRQLEKIITDLFKKADLNV
jgi:ribonuclease P protein component